MALDKYRVPAGVKIRPSQIGHYNFWYPHEKQEYVSVDSFICDALGWHGSDDWQAIAVSSDNAVVYHSPIKVLWVQKSLFKDMRKAPLIREQLKARAGDDG
jgi:hypothetical protein